MTIRLEQTEDQPTVRELLLAAFEGPGEANLVEALRIEASPIVSLVSVDGDTINGHILFSPVTLSGDPNLNVMGLAPMAVWPQHQRTGIGSDLVRAGLDACRELGTQAVVVLGHPEYYPRFGFHPSKKYSIDSEYNVPEDVFMAMELKPGTLTGKTGRISYHEAFGRL